MTDRTEQTRRTVEGFYAALRAGDTSQPPPVHDDLVIYEPATLPHGGTYRGLAQVQQGLLPRLAQVFDLSQLTVLELVADGDNAVGTLRAPVAGRDAVLLLSEHHRLEGGRIKEIRVFVYDAPGAPVHSLFPAA
jgi:ketosteroid isomerase-like protein